MSDYCREQLMTALSQQLDEDALEGDERAQALRSGSRMIDDGTAPAAANFARFEPVMNADGSIRALRFVFPPAQVGPYSDGTRTVDVPAQVLVPLVALTILFGVYPKPVLDMSAASVQQLVSNYNTAISAVKAAALVQ